MLEGIAEIGSWNYNFKAWVFSGAVNGATDAASHQIGHTLYLYHDANDVGVEYYGGHNNWGPIMGYPSRTNSHFPTIKKNLIY